MPSDHQEGQSLTLASRSILGEMRRRHRDKKDPVTKALDVAPRPQALTYN